MLAAGSQPNFFDTPGAAENTFPLYSLDNATRLRSRILGLFEQVDRDPALVERGALNFVVVGGGPTGVEVAGALADMIELTVPAEYRNFDASRGADLPARLRRRAAASRSRTGARLRRQGAEERGVELHLGTGVKEVGPGHALLSDGTVIPTRCVVWGGGISGGAGRRRRGLAPGRGGRVDVQPDLALAGSPGVYVDRRHRQHPRPRR